MGARGEARETGQAEPRHPALDVNRIQQKLSPSGSLIGVGCWREEPWGCPPHIVASSGDPEFGNIAPEGDRVVSKALTLTECP